MQAKEWIRQGKLQEARADIVKRIQSSPDDAAARTVYFQILAFLGEWDKAQTQLDILSTQDPQRHSGYKHYEDLVRSEKERERVLTGEAPPSYLPHRPSYADIHEEAMQALAEGAAERAGELLSQVQRLRPKLQGRCNGRDISGFRDTDSRLAPFLEAMVYGRYFWIPLESVRELTIPAPRTLLDTLWATANITTWEGLTLTCALPVLYPFSFRHENDLVKLGRRSEWKTLGEGLFEGIGQHVYETDTEEIALLEIRELSFELAATSGSKEDVEDHGDS